jgi:Spy/CpxP family protein refolding chaperone
MTTKTKMVCGLVALFAAGVVVGGSVGFTAAKRTAAPKETEQRREHGSRRDFADKWCSKLSDDLNLTPEQVERIKPITEDTSAQLKAVHADNSERVRQIFKASHQKIRTILTAEQLEIFDQKNRERESKFRNKGSSSKPKC